MTDAVSTCTCTLCRKRAGLPVAPVVIEHSTPSDLPSYSALVEQLAAMTSARDEACEIAEDWIDTLTRARGADPYGDDAEAKSRIAELRKVGTHD